MEAEGDMPRLQILRLPGKPCHQSLPLGMARWIRP
jgi:hypothetical protein